MPSHYLGLKRYFRTPWGCTNQQPPQRGGSVPNLVWVGSKWLLDFLRVPVTPGHSPFIFSLCCPLNDRRRAAHSFFKIVCLFFLSLFSCFSLARLCLLLLFLMSGNVHPNPGLVVPCSVCAENATKSGKSVQCCTCSKWVHLRCSQLSLSKFRTLDSSHSWSYLPCCGPTCNIVTLSSDSFNTYTSTVQSSPSSANAALPSHTRLQIFYLPSAHLFIFSVFPHTTVPCSWLFFYTSSPPDSLRVLQWNAGGLRARSAELLHFLSSHPVDLICIQESNLSSYFSFRIPGFSVLRSDRTHSRSGILSPYSTHASGGVIIFVRQGYLSLNLLPPLFLCSIPTLIMQGSTSLLTTPPRFHFLM